jgi:ferredoxin--NADP+ reductase
LTPTLAVFRFVLDGGVPPFEPGQFILLGLGLAPGETLWRAYSIATPPEVTDHVELYIRWAQVPLRGRFTTALWRLTTGDAVLWKPPRGTFTIAERAPDGSPDERRLLLVAGGTGLAPFVSVVQHLRHAGTTREIVLCHGARHVAELGYRELLADLEQRSRAGDPPSWHFRYLPTVSRPREAGNEVWRGHTGRVDTLLLRTDGEPSAVERAIGEALEPRNTCVYVCGFAGTVESVLAVVEPMGFRTRRNPRPDGSYDARSESFG